MWNVVSTAAMVSLNYSETLKNLKTLTNLNKLNVSNS